MATYTITSSETVYDVGVGSVEYITIETGLQGPQGPAATEISATEPSSPFEGMLWYKSDSKELYVYRDTSFERIPLVDELNGDFGGVLMNGGYF